MTGTDISNIVANSVNTIAMILQAYAYSVDGDVNEAVEKLIATASASGQGSSVE